MKVAIICPTNTNYMPYLDNYLCVLSKIGIDYDLIVWDRFKIDNFNLFTYQDKIGRAHV